MCIFLMLGECKVVASAPEAKAEYVGDPTLHSTASTTTGC